MKITVLMAVCNGQTYLKECMESVLSQTYRDFEFLIVDDGSTEATRDIIKSYKDSRIRLIENGRNLSQVISLNVGLDHARGEYIARIDADDSMFPCRLEKQLNFLISKPEVALAGSWGEAVDIREKKVIISRLPSKREEIIATILCSEFVSIHSSFMFRREAALDVGKYKEAFSFMEDYKLIVDLLLRGYHVNNIPETLIRYRFHDDRISVRDSKPQFARYLIAFRQFIENFTERFSEEEHKLLLDFLVNIGSMNKEYWKNGLRRKDMSEIIKKSNLLLNSVADYFKLKKIEDYFMKRVFYNRILNFTYQSYDLKKSPATLLYRWCLRNCFFVLERPKLYLYPFMAFLSYFRKRS